MSEDEEAFMQWVCEQQQEEEQMIEEYYDYLRREHNEIKTK